MKGRNVIREPERDIPVVAEVDVLVSGGGPAGLTAAVAAARAGARTMLVERWSFLGGTATMSNVCILFGYGAVDSDEQIVAGIPEELYHRIERLDGATGFHKTIRRPYFVPEALKLAAEELALDAKVQLRYHSFVCGVVRHGHRLDAAIVESKSGRQAVRANLFVDATGDGDLAYLAGCPTQSGRSYDGLNNSTSSIFFMAGVEPLSREHSHQVQARLAEEVDAGRLRIRAIPHFTTYMPGMPGLMAIHISRSSGDMTDVEQLTKAEIANRRDHWKLVRFLRYEFPQLFGGAYIVDSAVNVGIRESRRVMGQYVLTAEDVLAGAKFDDAIARGSWLIDIHCPLGYTSSKSQMCNEDCQMPWPCDFRDAGEHLKIPSHRLTAERSAWPPKGDWYDIPYRSLVPQEADNLLVAGRCISGTFEAQAAFRVMGTCMAMGQAAGTAAAICTKRGIACSALDSAELRRTLGSDGALV